MKIIQEIQQKENTYDTIFREHEILNISYENLSENYEYEMLRIQKFLGVKYLELNPLTKKQQNRPLSRVISNYSELKKQFGGTPWIKFFKD